MPSWGWAFLPKGAGEGGRDARGLVACGIPSPFRSTVIRTQTSLAGFVVNVRTGRHPDSAGVNLWGF